MNYPETYLYIYHNHSGESWVQEIKNDWLLDMKTRVKYFLKTVFSGELKLDGELIQAFGGEYTATIYTDGRKPNNGICWESAGFRCKATY